MYLHSATSEPLGNPGLLPRGLPLLIGHGRSMPVGGSRTIATLHKPLAVNRGKLESSTTQIEQFPHKIFGIVLHKDMQFPTVFQHENIFYGYVLEQMRTIPTKLALFPVET